MELEMVVGKMGVPGESIVNSLLPLEICPIPPSPHRTQVAGVTFVWKLAVFSGLGHQRSVQEDGFRVTSW